MIRIKPWKGGSGWEVDIRTRGPAGEKIRLRVKSPAKSPSGSLRWAQGRERELIEFGLEGSAAAKAAAASEIPTLEAFAKRFIEEYAEANRQKPSGIAAKQTIFDTHLIPLLGQKRLDEIGPAEVQKVKLALKGKNAKTTNNVLSVLHTALTVAAEWGVLPGQPCAMSLLPYERPERAFWDFEELEQLVGAARDLGWREHLVVLLGSKAGLRCGEIMALAWTDVDLKRQRLAVRSSEWKGQLTETKGRKVRLVPLASPLYGALKAHRHLRSERVLTRDDGTPLTQKIVRTIVQRCERAASLRALGVHALRHTFCSHLAMRGVPARAIQELAGHAHLSTTMGYMHLSPAAVESAIRTLETGFGRGEIGETASGQDAK